MLVVLQKIVLTLLVDSNVNQLLMVSVEGIAVFVHNYSNTLIVCLHSLIFRVILFTFNLWYH